MASEKELLEAVKEALQKDNYLGKIKAELRTAVLNVLEQKPPEHTKPKLTEEIILINELIREYFEWNGFRYSTQMLLSESGHPYRPTPRREIAHILNITEDSRNSQLPLLYSIITSLKSKVAHT